MRRCVFKKIHYLTFDLDLGVKVTRNVTQFPLHHVIYAPTKFEVATSNGLGEDTITRNVTDRRKDRLWYEIDIPYFSYEKAGIINIFEIVNFPFLDDDVPHSTFYGVYISQLICFARASSYVADFNTHNKLLTQKLLNKAIGIINFAKHFQNFIDDTMI